LSADAEGAEIRDGRLRGTRVIDKKKRKKKKEKEKKEKEKEKPLS